MSFFTVSLADIPIGIQSIDPDMHLIFADYISSERPYFVVSPSEKDLEYESIMAENRNGVDIRNTPDWEFGMERQALLRMIANKIPEYNAILFHCSSVAVDGKAYVFAARSGMGKTTHSRLWLQQLPQAYILNGDKPFLRVTDDGQVLVCGTPWRGKENLGCNKILPLEAICLLEQSRDNQICSITPLEASHALIHQAHIPEGIAGVRAIQLLSRISCEVKLFRLKCNIEPEAARVSIRAMIGHDLD